MGVLVSLFGPESLPYIVGILNGQPLSLTCAKPSDTHMSLACKDAGLRKTAPAQSRTKR